MANRNLFIETFQQALTQAGFDAGKSGLWDEATRGAMHDFQKGHGFEPTPYPDAQTLALLGVHPVAWAPIAVAAGAPQAFIAELSAQAQTKIAQETGQIFNEAMSPDKATVSRDSMTTADSRADRTGASNGAVTSNGLTTTKPKVHLPAWGWALIGGGAVLLIVGGVVLYSRRRQSR